MVKVKTFEQLQKAINNNEKEIELLNSISSPYSLSLKDGQNINGNNNFLSFINSDGLMLEGNNKISDLSIQTNPEKLAIFVSSELNNLGVIELNNLTVVGVVQILTRKNNNHLKLKVNNLDIVSADSRNYPERPMKYGVIVYQGAFTVYNFNPNPDSLIEVNIENLNIGRKNAPVIGSGVFIAGFNDDGGKVEVSKLVTKEVYSNGMIPSGVANLITGGVFILNGTNAKEVLNKKTVTTYGTNDMALDVWSHVDNWISEDEVITFGPSGIGFVNFGTVDNFVAKKAIKTYGLGARGFNQYDGTIKKAQFHSIETFEDGSIGMQFSKPVGEIVIENDILTRGSQGETLVKGVIQNLKADAISVKEGGEIKKLVVKGSVIVEGNDVRAFNIDNGKVDEFLLGGKLIAKRSSSKEMSVTQNGKDEIFQIEKFTEE